MRIRPQHLALVLVAVLLLSTATPVVALQAQQNTPGTGANDGQTNNGSNAPVNSGQQNNTTTNNGGQTTGTGAGAGAGAGGAVGPSAVGGGGGQPNSGANGGSGGAFSGFDLSLYDPEQPICEDMGSATGYACDSFIGMALGIGEAIMDFYAQVMNGVIQLLVERPRPLVDGAINIVERPTNPPMGAVYDFWNETSVPTSLCLLGFFMVLNLFSGIIPGPSTSKYSQSRAFERGVFAFIGILATWMGGGAALVLSHALSATLAPGMEQLAADPQGAQADSAAAIIGAFFIYLGYGVVAALALIQFLLTYIASYVLLPALPFAMVLRVPQFWFLDRLQPVGDKVIGLFVPCVFWPVPTAFVLGVGYPITSAIAEAVPDLFAFIPGVAPTAAGAVGILRLFVWMGALLAPLLVFTLTSPSKALLSVGAGAMGGYAAGSASSSGGSGGSGAAPSALPAGSGSSSGSSAATAATSPTRSVGADPVKGSSRSLGAGTAAGALPGGSTSTPTRPGGVSASSASSTGTGASPLGNGGSGQGGFAVSGGRAPGPAGVTRVSERDSFDGDRQYEVGTLSEDDEFDPIVPHPMSGEAIVDRGRGVKLQEASHTEDRDLIIRDEDTRELYDISQIAERDRDYDTQLTQQEQTQQSRDVVFGTRTRTGPYGN